MLSLDFERIGRAHEFLVSRRVIRSAVQDGRLSEADTECADLILSMDDAEREALERLLQAQGWALREFNDTMPGIPGRGRLWMTVRLPGAAKPSLLNTEPVWRRVALRSNETRAVTTYWVTFLWLTMLSFMYERIGRPLSAVSDYTRAVVAQDEIEERVEARLEEIRSSGGLSGPSRLPIAEALVESGPDQPTRRIDIRRRVGNFLACMEEAAMIEPLRGEENSYRQTLLCAVQLNDLYAHGLVHIVPPERMVEEMDQRLSADAPPPSAGEG